MFTYKIIEEIKVKGEINRISDGNRDRRQLTVNHKQKSRGKILLAFDSLMSTLNISLSLYIIILIAGCSNKPKDKFIEPELFAKIYVDTILQSGSPASSDSLHQLQRVLEKYNVTREEFETSITYFENHTDLWLTVYTKIVEELETRESADKENESKDIKSKLHTPNFDY